MRKAAEPGHPSSSISAHALNVAQVASALSTDANLGLASSEALKRLAVEGPNKLEEDQPVTVWRIIAGQFASLLIAILFLAAAISLVVGEIGDAAVIGAIILLNALLGAFQELRAERALAALNHVITPTTQVVRDGNIQEIPAADLVRGDLVLLQTGDLAPADLRLTQSFSLLADESPLTGESVPVQKSAEAQLEETTSLGDRANCAYLGTSVAYGRGYGLVYATGMNTELGQIAHLVSTQKRAATPLQQRLGILGKQLAILALGLCAIVFLAGWFRGQDLLQTFLVSISLAVAAIPEGLPAVVTIALALGLQRMLRRRALIRRLAAVETLGAATVICTDKTGTLTRGEMAVERIYLGGNHFHLDGDGLTLNGQPKQVDPSSPLHALLVAAALCNDARIQVNEGSAPRIIGSPTEAALLSASQRLIGDVPAAIYPRIAEHPFDSQRKRMSTAHLTPQGETLVLVKGAPEVVLPLCSRVSVEDGDVPLDRATRDQLHSTMEELASQAYRLLAVASRRDQYPLSGNTEEVLESDLTLLGLLGLMDPPRPETAQAVAVCKQAGMRTIMVTGDHANTAAAIATSVGILTASDSSGGAPAVVDGPMVDQMGEQDLVTSLEHVRVFARVAPSHKLRIVEALQSQGQVVAMTGDGSNDAPALKRADIGVAMGIRGTAVSKEAADMVLTDDNFQSIVSAVHEGRVIYANIRKVVMYLLSCNLGEILAVFVAMVLGLPLLLQPIQILWVNLVTDGLPALALSVEPEEPGIMSRRPRNPREGILTGKTAVVMITQGVVVGLVTLTAFLISLQLFPGDEVRAQTAAFITLTLSELFRAFSFRTEIVSVLRQGLLSNRWIVWAILVSAGLLAAVVFLPPLQSWFKTTTPNTVELIYMGPLILLPFLIGEVTKGLLRKFAPTAS